jgi:coenzyme F420-reducing hydrogenase delta subunit
MNKQDSDYERGMDGIVITTEERLDCEYERGADGVVITTEERTGL